MALQMRALTSTTGILFIASCLALAALLAAQGDLLLLGVRSAGSRHYSRVTFRPQHGDLTGFGSEKAHIGFSVVVLLRSVEKSSSEIKDQGPT